MSIKVKPILESPRVSIFEALKDIDKSFDEVLKKKISLREHEMFINLKLFMHRYLETIDLSFLKNTEVRSCHPWQEVIFYEHHTKNVILSIKYRTEDGKAVSRINLREVFSYYGLFEKDDDTTTCINSNYSGPIGKAIYDFAHILLSIYYLDPEWYINNNTLDAAEYKEKILALVEDGYEPGVTKKHRSHYQELKTAYINALKDILLLEDIPHTYRYFQDEGILFNVLVIHANYVVSWTGSSFIAVSNNGYSYHFYRDCFMHYDETSSPETLLWEVNYKTDRFKTNIRALSELLFAAHTNLKLT